MAFCRVIPNLYFTSDSAGSDPVTAKAYDYTSANLDIMCDDTSWKAAIAFNNTVKPFDHIHLASSHHSLLDASLSRVITKVIQTLVQSPDRFSMVSSLICCVTVEVFGKIPDYVCNMGKAICGDSFASDSFTLLLNYCDFH